MNTKTRRGRLEKGRDESKGTERVTNRGERGGGGMRKRKELKESEGSKLKYLTLANQ